MPSANFGPDLFTQECYSVNVRMVFEISAECDYIFFFGGYRRGEGGEGVGVDKHFGSGGYFADRRCVAFRCSRDQTEPRKQLRFQTSHGAAEPAMPRRHQTSAHD